MRIIERDRRTELILMLAKLVSLIFCAFILSNENIALFSDFSNSVPAGVFIAAFLLIVGSSYTSFALLATRNFTKILPDSILILESIFLILCYFFVVQQTGMESSLFKLLFLFAIIPAAIQMGQGAGFLMAGVASVFILTMHLPHSPGTLIRGQIEFDLMLILVFFLIVWLLSYYVRMGKEQIRMLERHANYDAITGLYNHRRFYELLLERIESYKEGRCSVALLLMDVDNFRDYNDTFGHEKGDEALRIMSGILTKAFDATDSVVARYGGDAFAVILCNCEEKDIWDMAHEVRQQVQKTFAERVRLKKADRPITLSIGISCCADVINSDLELIKTADDALYRAKLLKKNRVEIYNSTPEFFAKTSDTGNTDLITSLRALIHVINAKDRYTHGHVERVVMYAKLIAERLSLPEPDKRDLLLAAYVHDIGKINISEKVLVKPGTLTKQEYQCIMEHSEQGARLLKEVADLAKIAPLVQAHHERYDGKGYPHQLKGEEIPFLARILAVADSFDAMTYDRPYKPAMTPAEAAEEIRRNMGTQFDPDIANSFVAVILEGQLV